MDCPVCDKAMIAVELHQVGGLLPLVRRIWLDAGELEILLDDPQKAGQVVASLHPVPAATQTRQCPICRKRMEIVDAGGSGAVLLDRCRRQHGLWFDRGELPALLERASLDTDGHIRSHLKELFIQDQGKEST
jgi:Zn-finger nucleic acid-binding protein